MIKNNGNTNKRSSIKDFLRKINSNKGNGIMSAAIPSASHDTMTELFQSSMDASSSQLCLSSLSSSLHSSQYVPMSLRKLPIAVLDEIWHLQQQRQFEVLQQEQRQMEVMPSQQHPQAAMLETFKKHNTIMWERLKHCEDTIKNLEETQSKLARTNAKLEVDLHDQIDINKKLVQRNTIIVLDTSSKDQQILVLKDQKKCLTKQSIKLKKFLRQADSCLDTLKSQQYILQLQHEQMQRNAATAAEGVTPSSGSKKRKRDNEQNEELICAISKDRESTHVVEGSDAAKAADDCHGISISIQHNRRRQQQGQPGKAYFR
jgi:hypothetical protein